MTCEHIHDSGPYVLGALSPAEREEYERHLVDCAECRAEVAELAMLPSLLARVDAQTAEAVAAGGEDAILGMMAGDPPYTWAGPTAWRTPTNWAGPSAQPTDDQTGVPLPTLPVVIVPGPASVDGARNDIADGASVAETVAAGGLDQADDATFARVLDLARARRRRERRRARWQAVGVGFVAACLAIAAMVGVRAADLGAPAYHGMKAVVAASPVTADIALEAAEGGTLIRMRCWYAGEDHGKWLLRLVVLSKLDGTSYEVSNWTAMDGDALEMASHTTLKPTEIERVELRRGDQSPLLTYDP
jgi:hypothetical protein